MEMNRGVLRRAPNRQAHRGGPEYPAGTAARKRRLRAARSERTLRRGKYAPLRGRRRYGWRPGVEISGACCATRSTRAPPVGRPGGAAGEGEADGSAEWARGAPQNQTLKEHAAPTLVPITLRAHTVVHRHSGPRGGA